MTIRWAYEAMAVEQFRSSKYMKPYFRDGDDDKSV